MLTIMTTDPIVVQHPPRERWGEAVNLALSNRPYEERVRLTEMLLRPSPGKPPGSGFDGLLEARAGDATVGAALAALQAGRTALVYQPQLLPGVGEAIREKLNSQLTTYLRQHRVTLAQEVLPLDAAEDIARARAAGYAIEIHLVYLTADQSCFPAAPEGALDWEAFEPSQTQRLAEVLDRTFVGTLDCAELNGVRSTLDAIAGYQASGQFRPRDWQFAKHQNQDVGCVLVNRHDDHTAELVYLGLTPEARGKGWSRELVRRALWQARQAGCAVLSLAVDARNQPALSAYERAGFERFDARCVLLRVFDDEGDRRAG
jgi:ribosomal protein S18 acetylase RimI-like enzyme